MRVCQPYPALRAHFADVLHSEVHASGTYALAQPVIRVVIVPRKHFLPPLYEGGRHGLCADMHKPPPRKVVIGEVYLPAVYRVEYVLRPRHEQPDYGHLFLGHGLHYPSGTYAFEQYGAAARQETAEPMHLRPRVIERRHTQEDVVVRLRVMMLFRHGGAHQRLVAVEYRLRKTRRAAGKIYRRQIFVVQRDVGFFGGNTADEVVVTLRKRRALFAHEKHTFNLFELAEDGFHAPDELFAEHQHADVRKVKAIFYLFRRIAVVERHRKPARFQDAEINGQPFEAVHKQNADLLSPAQSARKQQIGKPVRQIVELFPSHFTAVFLVRSDLHQRVILPGELMFFFELGVYFDEARFIPVKVRVPLQKLCYRHNFPFILCRICNNLSDIRPAQCAFRCR